MRPTRDPERLPAGDLSLDGVGSSFLIPSTSCGCSQRSPTERQFSVRVGSR